MIMKWVQMFDNIYIFLCFSVQKWSFHRIIVTGVCISFLKMILQQKIHSRFTKINIFYSSNFHENLKWVRKTEDITKLIKKKKYLKSKLNFFYMNLHLIREKPSYRFSIQMKLWYLYKCMMILDKYHLKWLYHWLCLICGCMLKCMSVLLISFYVSWKAMWKSKKKVLCIIFMRS